MISNSFAFDRSFQLLQFRILDPCGRFLPFTGSNFEKYEKLRKKRRFSGQILPDWGNTAQTDMAGLGSIMLSMTIQ